MNRIDYPVNDFNLELFLYSENFEKMSSNKFTHKSEDITITLFDSSRWSRCGFTKMKFKRKNKPFDFDIPKSREDAEQLFNNLKILFNYGS